MEMEMTVNELITLLSTVKDKTKTVNFFVELDYIKLPFSNEIIENDEMVLLGDNLSPELYEKDYKYER
jgi:hypothetical protein